VVKIPETRDPLELAIVAAEAAQQRANRFSQQYEQAHIALGEALFWLCSADDELKKRQGVKIYKEARAADPRGRQLLGIHHIRNFVAHEPLPVAHDGSKPFLVASWDESVHGKKEGVLYISPPFVWPEGRLLPCRSDSDRTKLDYKRAYDDLLAGQNCNGAVGAGVDWCWWGLGLWEGADAITESCCASTYDRPCPDCGGRVQIRHYDDTTSTPGRRTFWCVTRSCKRSTLPALLPAPGRRR